MHICIYDIGIYVYMYSADCSPINPGAQSAHLTSQLSWSAVWLFVKRVCLSTLWIDTAKYWGVAGQRKCLVLGMERETCPR